MSPTPQDSTSLADSTQPRTAWWISGIGIVCLVGIPLGWWLKTYPPAEPRPPGSEILISSIFERTPQLTQVRERGYLRVATLINPTIYVPDKNQPQGLEYDLATRFAQQLGLGVKFIIAKNINEAYQLVDENKADFAAAGLVVSLARERLFRYGPSYVSVRRQLVYRQGVPKPQSLDDIGSAPLAVEKGSSSLSWLTEQAKKGLLTPDNANDSSNPQNQAADTHDYTIQVQLEDTGISTLKALETGAVDYAVMLSHETMLGQKISNKIHVATDLGPPVSFAWAFSRHADKSLYNASVMFFNEIRSNHELKNLIDRHYAQFEQLDQRLAQQFLDDVESRIAPYLSAFKKAGEKYDIDWRLLAAMGYQESKWQPDATSHQGAYGLMQITLPTAQELGLHDRGDPVKSIMSAAKYLSQLRAQVPERAKEPDLTYFAIAAYNIGIGHLSDAFRLTAEQGGDPNRWQDVRDRLTELSDPKIYRKLRYGYARGEETVQYVENIRALHDLMIWVGSRNEPNLAQTHELTAAQAAKP